MLVIEKENLSQNSSYLADRNVFTKKLQERYDTIDAVTKSWKSFSFYQKKINVQSYEAFEKLKFCEVKKHCQHQCTVDILDHEHRLYF